MLHLNVHLMYYFREHLKMYKNVKEKINFILHLMTHLKVQSRGAPEGTLEGAPNDTLTNLHKDEQEGAFEVALKGELEVALVDAIINLQIRKKMVHLMVDLMLH